MARTLDPAAHSIRREAFLDVAQRLIQSKGYEEMSVQDVLDELGVSKGAFYHYFGSKEALLAAVVDRMVEAATAAAATAPDPGATAFDKLTGLFASIAQWKGERTELMLELVQVWLSDANSLVRDQLRRGVEARLTPTLATIVRQGIDEGTFSCRSPEHTAAVFVALVLGLNDAASRVLLARRAGNISYEEAMATFAAYTEAFERILGLPDGTWPIVDEKVTRFWFG